MSNKKRSFFTSWFDKKQNIIHVWEVDERGKVHHSQDSFVPYIFELTPPGYPTSTNTFRNLEGKPVVRKSFTSYREYRSYIDMKKDDDRMNEIFENHFSPPESQFIVEKYLDQPPYERQIYNPRAHFYDIEVNSTNGFPEPEPAKEMIQSIAIYDSFDKETRVYGLKSFNAEKLKGRLKESKLLDSCEKLIDSIKYIQCEDEIQLLCLALKDMATAWIYIGWNSEEFDFPYIYNRCKRLASPAVEAALKNLSPVGMVQCYRVTGGIATKGVSGKRNFRSLIAGKVLFDQMVLYKKFSYQNQSSYALDYIGQAELSLGKIQIYKDKKKLKLSLDDLYQNYFEEFILYNARDVEIMVQLDQKYEFNNFIHSISVRSNVTPDKAVNISTVVDGSLLYYLKKQKLVAPANLYNHSAAYPGAYVKETLKGLYDWVVDFDITSSYPSMMITINISSETHLGQIYLNKDQGELIQLNRRDGTNKSIPVESAVDFHKALTTLEPTEIISLVNPIKEKVTNISIKDLNVLVEKKAITTAGDGSIYSQLQEGIMPQFLKEAFFDRIKVKESLIEQKRLVEIAKGSEKNEIKDIIKKLNAQQLFCKLIINAVYGQLGNRFSRWYNLAAASSVTISGQITIKKSEEFLNEFFGKRRCLEDRWIADLFKNLSKFKFWKTENCLREKCEAVDKKLNGSDFILAVDTDSNFLYLGEVLQILLEDVKEDVPEEAKVQIVLGICKTVMEYLNYRIKTEIKEDLFNSGRTDFDINFKQEIIARRGIFIGKKKYGVWVINRDGVSTDKVDVTGIEIIKSDTPKAVKGPLKEVLNLVLKSDESNTKIGEKIQGIIKSTEIQLKQEELMDIAVSMNLNKMAKYGKNRKRFQIPKSCPIHIRSAFHFNDLLNELKLTKNYFPIKEGSRIFFLPVVPATVQLKKHNVTSLGFMEDFPEEFYKVIKVDYEKLFQKVFLDKLKIILNPIEELSIYLDTEKFLIKALFG